MQRADEEKKKEKKVTCSKPRCGHTTECMASVHVSTSLSTLALAICQILAEAGKSGPEVKNQNLGIGAEAMSWRATITNNVAQFRIFFDSNAKGSAGLK